MMTDSKNDVDSVDSVAEAKAEAQASREQLFGVIDDIRYRLSPSTIKADLLNGARQRGVAVVRSARDRGVAVARSAERAKIPLLAIAGGVLSFLVARRMRSPSSAPTKLYEPSDIPSQDGDPTMADRIKDKAHAAKSYAGEKLGAARDRSAEYVRTAREKSSEYAGAAREKTTQTVNSVAEGVQTNPLSAVLAGLAAGVVLGALLPRTNREAERLGKYSKKVTDAARTAALAARDAGRQALAEQGINADAAKQKLEEAKDIAKTAASRAGKAAKQNISA